MKKRGVGLKGQVTAFIIVGIVLLITVSSVIYLRGRMTKDEGIEVVTAPKVSAEFAPISTFVKSCIVRITGEGIELTENRGGYLYQEDLEVGRLDPTEGNAVELIPNSGVLVPYWHYMESPNPCTNCGFIDSIPPLCKAGGSCLYAGSNSVEEQLERYVEENIKPCMDEFDTERLGYEIVELEEPNAMVTISDKNVVVNLRYPLEIKKGGSSTEMNRFISTIQSEFTEMYTIAYELTRYQMNNCFIGRHTQSFLSYHMGLGDGQLPPLAKQTMGEANPKIWFMAEVKETLKPRISAAVSSMGLLNTKNFWFPKADPNSRYNKTIQGILDQRVFTPFSKYYNANVFIKYLPFWEIYADVRPREGQKIMPTDLGGPDAGSITQIISDVIQIKDYTFSYQYSFPVVIDIQKTDFMGEPHTFRFGIEVNVRANRCIGNDTSISHVSNPSATQLCNSIHATESSTVTVKETIDVKGYPTEVNVEDVIIKFLAGSACLLGSTDGNGVLELNYPSVHGGHFIFSKGGYGSVTVNNSEMTDTKTVQMYRFKEFKVDIEHYKIIANRTTGERTLDGPYDLIPGEKVIIGIEKLDEPSLMPQLVAFEGGVEREYKLNLLPEGNYDITANYFTNQTYTLPAKCAHVCEGSPSTNDVWDFAANTSASACCGEDCPTDGSDCVCEIPGDVFDLLKCCPDSNNWLPDEASDVSIMGGARFDETQPWYLSKGILNSGDTVVFKVISLPKVDCMVSDDCVIPGCLGYSSEMDNLDIYYDTFWGDLSPEIE